MARIITKTWRSNLAAGRTRRDRQPCSYEAYVPDPLLARRLRLSAETAARVAEAEREIAALDAGAVALTDTDALARILLRAECVASSRIEGLEPGARRLLRAELADDFIDAHRDVTAEDVLANVEAARGAIASLAPGGPVTLEALLRTHERLLAGGRLHEHAGRLRETQNWIGGSDYNPCSAAYVPPPSAYVPDLLADLVDFVNDDGLPAVAQAALAHAQFETIHPFADGNGRVGRVLIHLVLRRRALATRVLTPVSLVLATNSRGYVAALVAARYRGAASSRQADDAADQLIAFFADACLGATHDAWSFERRIESIEQGWRERLGVVRRDSAAERLLRVLPGTPLVTVELAAKTIGRSFQATNEAVERLVGAGILTPITVGRRNRAFEAGAIVDAFTDLERRLASPGGDTHTSPPARLVPPRRP